MEKADIGCPLSEHADGHAIPAGIFVAQRQPRSQRHVRPYNGMPTPKILRYVRHVHGSAPALRNTTGLSEQLGHHLIGRNPAVDRHAMVTVGGDNPVLWLPCRDQPGAYSLLSDI